MFRMTVLSVACVAALALVASDAHVARADTATDVRCSRADAHMTAMMPHEMSKATGDLDKDFAVNVAMMSHAMKDMAALEVRCGNNSTAKAHARRIIELPPWFFTNLEITNHTP